MSSQLSHWQGQFGVDYADRNVVDPGSRVEGFNQMLHGLGIESVLEVGCNRGHNLAALGSLGYIASGVEPGGYARALAQEQGLDAHDGTLYDIPYTDRSFDLVFTSGVLIHVPPERLLEGLAEMSRVTSRYLLCVEYHAATDTELRYRGLDGMLWCRDHTAALARLHGFTVIRCGDAPEGFDGASFAIAERSL